MRRRYTQSQQNIRRQRRRERVLRRERDTQHLRELAERQANRKRRSLRLQWFKDNAEELVTGNGPCFKLVLYGEEGYTDTDPSAPGTYPYEGYGRIFMDFWYGSDSDY
jgi:hypothetical protein